MPIDEDIDAFKEWALSLGFPCNAIPPNNVLKRLFSSGQSLAFNQLMQRVRPMQEVKKIRDAIAVRRTENTGIGIVAKDYQSKEMQRYLRIKSLEGKLADIKKKNATKVVEYQRKCNELKEKNLEKLHLMRKNNDLMAELSIYKVRLDEIDEQKRRETETSERIRKATPIEMNMGNCDVSAATLALTSASTILTEHYQNVNPYDRYEVAAKAQEELWNQLRMVLTNLPNFVLWDQLNKRMEKKTLTLDVLAKIDLSKMVHHKGDESNDSILAMEIAKLQAEHIKLVIDGNGIDDHDERLSHEYVVFYEQFLSHLRTKFAMYNNTDIDEDTLADYISQWTALRFGEGEVEYLRKAVDDNETEIRRIRKLNDEYKATHTTLFDMYDEIQEKYCNTRDELANLSLVKEKILHSKNVLRYLLQCKSDQQSNLLSTTAMLHQTHSSNESTYLSDGHTNDFDGFSSTFAQRSDATMMRPALTSVVPLHVNELGVTFKVPVEKFSSQTPIARNFNLRLSPIVDNYIYDVVSKESESLLVDYSIAPYVALDRLYYNTDHHSKLKTAAAPKTIEHLLPTVDEQSLFIKQRQQDDALTKLINETRSKCVAAHQQIAVVKRYLKYFEENPLTKFLPRSLQYNGKSYQEYESEFMVYYNMVQDAQGAWEC